MSGITDFQYCVGKHTFNGDGSRGASGDLSATKCIIERVYDKTVDKK